MSALVRGREDHLPALLGDVQGRVAEEVRVHSHPLGHQPLAHRQLQCVRSGVIRCVCLCLCECVVTVCVSGDGVCVSGDGVCEW